MSSDEKYTFRLGDLSKDELQNMAEELELSLAEIMRQQARDLLELHESGDLEASPVELMSSHADNLINDEGYRDIHQEFYDDERDFEAFVHEEEVFDTKWVDETTVEYEFMFDNFRNVVYSAQKRNFDEAESIIDSLDQQGYDQEAFLLSSVVSEYRK